ncbi:voltage-gated potassium channel [Patellaria atrata CBS 101060]|uniref:Voltage-gated potassium channel n=1 Tax=Patellaria atrata CBS 101060 TaxID=1346257 RepID=A0A9P4SAM1_9PEZI|nr:voltage-gated potassium channel [Patellaria atrata CBS 101060]
MTTTDPGVDATIENAAKDVEKNPHDDHDKYQEEEERAFMNPSRWWFASTACPLIAGTFGPMANAFSICALVQSWRTYIPPGGTEAHGEPIKDPGWFRLHRLLAINSISLVCAISANVALLLNMARRLRFAIAQSITILGFFLASFLLIALVLVASTTLRLLPASEHALGQAYYYAIIAAGLYFIIASLMILTVVGSYLGHYEKEFRLTVSQRTLMIQTMGFVTYMLLGSLIFSFVEGWSFLNAVYWADFTLLTVGIGGTFVPRTHTGRSLLFPFAIGGIVMVGLVVGSVRSLVLDRGREKMQARMMEKRREKTVKSIDEHRGIVKMGMWTKMEFTTKGLTETKRREQEFQIMRAVQTKAENRRRWVALMLSGVAALLLWFLGALVFQHAEKNQQWTYFVSLYFSYTSLLTIGYGDYEVMSNSGKPFFVFWTLLAVPTLTILISNMGDTVVKSFKDFSIWIGSLTVLPDETGARSALKAGMSRLTKGRAFSKQLSDSMKKSAEQRDRDTNGHPGGEDRMQEDLFADRLAKHVESEELKAAREAHKEGDPVLRDVHFYHFVLAKELRQLLEDVSASPPKQYTYQEWAYYLKLIGHDEADKQHHRPPPKVPDPPQDRDIHEMGMIDKEDSGSEQGVHGWSWLGTRSPLMGNKLETEWILERIAEVLETELKKLGSHNPEKQREPPPISLDDFREKKS